LKTQESPQVDLIILNYNGKRFLDDCIKSVKQTNYPNFIIHLLDNNSTDDDVDYVRKNYPFVNIIQNPANNGFCAAYNLSFEQCTGKYFVCLNNDITVKPDWLQHLVDSAEADETIAALQPKIVSIFDEKKFEYAGSSGGMMDVYGFPFLRGRVFDTIEDDNGQYDDVKEIFWTCGAAMFIRAEVLKITGNLDEDIVHHMDEIELNWRMRLAGYSLKVIPASVILHYGGATIQQESFKKIYWNHRNSLYMMMKNYGLQNAITKTAVHIFLDWVAILQGVITLKFTRPRAILAAHYWNLLNFGLILKKRKFSQSIRKVEDSEIIKVLYPSSVVLKYFLFGKKTYSDLIKSISK